jgi:hypothetical protein
MAKVKKESKIKTTHETRLLRCELSQEEILKAGEALAKAMKDGQKLVAESESIKRALKAREAQIESEKMVQQSKIQDKFEMRNVPVDLILDYQKQEARAVRTDTGEIVDSRKMTQEELQMDLGFDETPAETVE